LLKELYSAKQLNNQINATKEQTQNSFKQISLQSKVQVTEIADLKTIQGNLEKKVKNLNSRTKDLEEREKIYKDDLISDLQKRNSRALKTQSVNNPNMGMGAGLSHGAGSAGPSGLNTSQDPTAQDTTILDNVTKPIVKVLGELFSREDKKSIPAFKGKSTDKLITKWLKAAEHVARNNDWDEDQKLFSRID
jgi:hypothetical protein